MGSVYEATGPRGERVAVKTLEDPAAASVSIAEIDSALARLDGTAPPGPYVLLPNIVHGDRGLKPRTV